MLWTFIYIFVETHYRLLIIDRERWQLF